MSFKDYFDKATTIQALANKSAQEIGAEVESVGYHEQDIVREERFIPQVDYTLPGTFARYGLAEEYYDQALKRIYDEYPYDGSLEERVKWENESTYLDLHIFDKEYPRTNGYISFSPSGWGALDGSLTDDGYGLPVTLEYIAFSGGPHPNPDGMTPYSTQFTGSNYYETAKNRENNLKYDLQSNGVSVEFWLKKAAFDPAKTEKEVVYDLWNGETAGTEEYGRLTIELSASAARVPSENGAGGLDPFLVTLFSGNVGIATASVCPDTLTTASVADDAWHHYAFTFMSASTSTGVDVNFYIDGTLSKTTALDTLDDRYGTSAGLNEVTGALRARLGSLIAIPSGSDGVAGAGKLSASLDEFRYWKTERSGKDIGRHWFTQVGGGTNDDPTPYVDTTEVINTNLGVYYKFNEGITGVAATDAVVLDFSGRITNGTWTGYTAAGRSTGSAIVESSAAIKEFKDPIIYSFHPEVAALATRLQISGSNYDTNNNASIYNSIPSWMVEEDIEGQSEIKHLTQILSSYFDTLHLQVESLSKIQNVEYVSGSSKPYPFADRRLASQGLFAPNLFLDADVLEKLADRSEDRVYEKSLTDIKNTIYQNIYNNLVYIYKSKGTEKAFRNMIRCFGIDDELVKLNAYAGNLEYEVRDNRRIVSVAEKFIDFNTADNAGGTVFQFQNPGDTTNTSGYLPGNTELTGGYAQTLEVDVLFPLKPSEDSSTYVDTNVISSSLFGVHGALDNEADTSWDFVRDASNFQVYAARDEITSDNVRFTLTGTVGGFVPELQSPLFEDVYNNTHWNLAVRIKPEQYPWAGAVAGYSDNYTVELHGVQLDAGIIQNQFTVSGTIASPAAGFVSGSKRVYVGAHRTNFTGALLQASDVKIDACRYWLDYLDDKTLAGHAYDTQNYGSLNPHYYAFPFASASFGEVLQADTLVFNWEFSANTGSNASGEFRVADESSGSAAIANTRFGWAGDLLSKQYTSLGHSFATSSVKTVDKDFILSSKLQLPENVQSSDMVNVLSQQDQNVFTRDSRPVNYFFAFEKSMAQAVSVEMINYFATLKDINNIIGAPVNRYRTEYKGLKILRQRFFERVSNDVIDFDKFYEFYKWFDTSLSTMIQQLVPASADFAENVRTLIESHVLERSKYQHKFQNVKQQLNTIEGTAEGSQQTGEMSQSPEDDPQGTGFYSLNAFSRRQLGSSQPINFKSWNLDHAPMGLTTPTPLSLLFDGTDEYVNIGTSATWDALIGLAGTDALPYSYSLWIKPAAWVSATPGIIMFGDNDRGLSMYQGSGPSDTKLYARINSGGSGRTATAGQFTQDVWQHITVTYAGNTYSTGTDLKIYINGSEATYASTSTGTPSAITPGADCVIGSFNPSGVKFAGNMADVAVWDKELSAAEITEIYGAGYRVNLSNSSCQSSLLSWWKLGNGTGDSYNGTLADEVGGRPGTPTNFDAAGDIEADSPAFSAGYNGAVQNSKTIWWRSRAGRSIAAISSSEGAVNTNKQVMLNSIEKGNTRAQNSVYRFGAGGNRTFGGVGSAANKKVNFVFRATEPFGGGTNVAPENVIIGLGSGVEQLINTTDEYHPAFKQRLGFDMDPDANRSGTDTNATDGNILAPFSIYSSSLDSAADSLLANNYATGTVITNLHHDLVYSSDIPAQGPFTEQFVGGRQFRHTGLNVSSSRNPSAAGLDLPDDRAEGWKIEFQGVSSSATTAYQTPMLGIVAANYDATSSTFYNADIPTAHRLRNVGTKRPVNIQNIKMTTASAGTNLSGVLAHGAIGNYQKNYQVVQSNSRRKNDPYFNDQSFDFAPYPETLATRGRLPLNPLLRRALTFDGSNDYVAIGANTTWEAQIGGAGSAAKPFTLSVWIRAKSGGDSYPQIITFGTLDRAIYIPIVGAFGATYRLYFSITGGTAGRVYSTTDGMTADRWYHVVATYSGGTAGTMKLYIDGTEDTGGTGNQAVSNPDAIAGADCYIGSYNATSYNFKGNMCDVAIWGRALSQSEVDTLYGGGLRINPKTHLSQDLISWWPLGANPNDSYNGIMNDEMNFQNGTPTNFAAGALDDIQSPSFGGFGSLTQNLGGNLDYTLPDRSGTNSNQSIIVNRFGAPGGYSIQSRGYMGPAHEEMSVYNALPYRNRDVINYGLSGSASVDPTETIVVVDQIDKNRGLDQRATLHCGPFGSDAAYGSVVASTYVTVPSWHKTNRNPRTRPLKTGTVYPPVPSIAWSAASSSASDRLEFGTVSDWEAAIGGSTGGGDLKSYSISTWFYIDEFDTSGTYLWELGASTRRAYFGSTGVTRALTLRACGDDTHVTSTLIATDQWYHLVVTFDASTGMSNCYINGVNDSNFPADMNTGTAWPITTTTLEVGQLGGNSGYDLIGQLAEWMVYTRVVTEAEAVALYNGGVVPTSMATISGSGGLIARYSFSAAEGDTLSNIYNRVAGGSAYDSSNRLNYSLHLTSGLDYTSYDTYIEENVYDNLYVQHQIPQSEQQYSWITASMASGEVIYGLDAPSCISSSTITQLMTGSQHTYFKNNYLANFVGMSDFTLEVSPDSSTHLATPRTTLPLRAGQFNGTTSKLVIGTPSTTPWDAVIGGTGASAKAFTLAAWIAPDDASGTRMIFGFGNYERRFYWSGTNLYFNIDGATDGTVRADDVVPAAKWTHVAATFKGGDPGGSGTDGYMKLYVNGVLQTVTVSSELNNPDDIAEGTFNSNIGVARTSDYEFDGEITEAAVWDEELTAADILTIYDQQFGGVLDLNTVGVSDLIAYYKFDTLLGDTAAAVDNRASSPTANTDGVGTDMSLGTYLHLSSVTGSFYRGSEYLKVMLNNQNGPSGWPTWKQIRAGETKVARSLRKQNLIGQIVPPPTLETDAGQIQGLQANTFVDYIEQPIASNAKPVFFAFEDNDANPDVANNLAMNVSYQNNLDYFSNEGLNNRLGVNKRRLVNVGTAFNTVADFTLSASLSTVIRYGERIYPAKTNAYQTRTRTRTEYDISTIWNDVRTLRSVGAYNSQGDFVTDASIWPLDAWSNFTTTGAVGGGGQGAGELQNTYARNLSPADAPAGWPEAFPVTSPLTTLSVTASVAYTMPIQVGTTNGFPVLVGAQPWSAARQKGINPYQPYIDYGERLRLVGKDMSIVPEFRISEHLSSYVSNHNSNFLTKLDNIFTLTGSSVSSSAGANFYKLYSTADFMKYFKVVDDELADKTNGGSQPIRRHSIELSCDALLQFLPYKGFYPAERVQELGALLSQSLGRVETITGSNIAAADRRILYEPLLSPGILCNTIKSGIAVGSMVMLGEKYLNISASAPLGSMTPLIWPQVYERDLAGGLTVINTNTGFYRPLQTLGSASVDTTTDLYAQQIPFEAIRFPEAYLAGTAFGNESMLPSAGIPTSNSMRENIYLYDTGTATASLGQYWYDPPASVHDIETSTHINYSGENRSPLYGLAIDNFLCETVNFFQTPLKSYVSKPEEEFLAVKKDGYYGMQVKLYASYTRGRVGAIVEDEPFGMYSRASAFGPLAAVKGNMGVTEYWIPSYEPWLPPYWNGHALVNVIFKAPYSGKVSLDEILSRGNTVYEYDKIYDVQLSNRSLSPSVKTQPAYQQITSSINVAEKLLVVPPDTDTQQARWLIQSKFETPVLNFYNTPATASVVGSSDAGFVTGDDITVRGMWHQYGSKLTGSQGIHMSLLELPTNYSSSIYGPIQVNSLSKIVGFETNQKRIGDFAEAKRIEEAIVCVPFLTDKGDRKFFDVDKESQEYVTQLSLLNKYIFPPTFDFLTNQTVDPIAFYAFEFNIDFSQDDLINIWQNLPPESNTEFQKKTATIKIQSLVNRLLDNDKDLQWMVFKVKRRAEKDYNVFTKKGLVDGLPIVEPAIDSPYSYNWPYDYFSLVELIKIDEDVVYATEDLIPEDNEGTPVIPDLREFIPAPEEMEFRISPRARILTRGRGDDEQDATSRSQNLRRGKKTTRAATTRKAPSSRKKRNKKR